jgi:RimJ/RimL family protein N-acetyltransferase
MRRARLGCARRTIARMRLRQATDADLDVLFEHWTDQDANRMAAFTSADPHDREAFDARWRRFRDSDDITARVIEVDGEVVGSIGSWNNDGEREVTYWIGRNHWGKGIATRALAEFLTEIETTRPIHAATAYDNVGSQRVLEKCGFRLVGRSRSFANSRDEEVDELLFRLER